MNINKLLIPVICGLALGLGACGGDSATEAEPVVSPFGGGDQPPVSAGVLSSTILSSASVPPVSNGQTAPLASAANLSIPANLYVSWLTYHYVTLESESSYYGSIASGFGHVFSAAYQPAARIIWSTAQSTPYSAQCKVDDTTMPIMKFRGCTVSEGIGYGMLISAMQGDEPTFVTLWNYSRAFRAYNGNQPLTPWITFSFHFNEIDLGSATDADLDIATSLILMYLKTTNVAYLNDALVIAGGIWDKEVKDNKLLSGDTRMWDGTKGPIVYNLSYFSPVALRLFAKYDTAHNWTAVLDAMYSYMAAIQAAGTGVFPDWSTETSSVNPPNDAAGNEKSGFTYYTFNRNPYVSRGVSRGITTGSRIRAPSRCCRRLTSSLRPGRATIRPLRHLPSTTLGICLSVLTTPGIRRFRLSGLLPGARRVSARIPRGLKPARRR